MISLEIKIQKIMDTSIKEKVDTKMKEFKNFGKAGSREIFKELCFCLLTANFNAERSIAIQNKMGNGFLSLPETKLAKRLKEFGHRYPNTRAKYIREARKYKNSLKKILSPLEEKEKRKWLVKNIKGLGYKESSHFLRNIGFINLAVIDFHIIDILARHKIIQKPKTLTKAIYLEIESKLNQLAEKLNISLAELDLYLWYMETGKVLK